MKRVTDPDFKWTHHGDVQSVWNAHGWKPTTEQERAARQKPRHQVVRLIREKK